MKEIILIILMLLEIGLGPVILFSIGAYKKPNWKMFSITMGSFVVIAIIMFLSTMGFSTLS